jgi:small conductance mechanosensitive channel
MLLASVALCLVWGSVGLATAADEGGTPTQSEVDVERLQSLVAARQTSLQESAALEADAALASGSDANALRLRAFELRLSGRTALVEMGTLVQQMIDRGDDVAPQIAEISAFLPAFWSSLAGDFELLDSVHDELTAMRSELSDADALSALDARADRHLNSVAGLLGVGVSGLELSEQLGISADIQREQLKKRVLMRARLLGSHLGLAFEELGDLGVRADSGADPATLAPIEAAVRHRLASTSDRLRAILDMMETLELDASGYRQLLIETTGEITVETIDRGVMREIVSGWAASIRESVASSAPNGAFALILFVAIMAVFYWISRIVRKVVSRGVEARHLRLSELLKRTVISLSSSTVIVVGFLIALSQLGIEIAPMLAGLGIAGFVLGFALQDTLANFAAGLMVLLYRPYDVEDLIDCAGGVFGRVSDMSLVSTTILTIDNKTLIVPNNKIWGDVITNVTAQKIRRVDLEFGIGYADDIPKAEKVMAAVLEEHPKILSEPEPIVKLHSLGDSSVNFVVRPWVETDDYWDVYWDVTREVKLRFDREGVSIPFPQRDVHFYPAEAVASQSAGTIEHEASGEMRVDSTTVEAQDEPGADDN